MTLDPTNAATGLTRWILVPAAGLTAAWLFMTHLPDPERVGVHVGHYDWLVHGAGYTVMASLWTCWILLRCPARAFPAGLVLAAMVTLGAADELTQPFFRREAAWQDWFADAAGSAIGCGAMTLLLAASQRRAGPSS